MGLPAIKNTNLYIHIPFCKSLCPYCPYNRVRYHKNLVAPYIKALLKEIDLYANAAGHIDISSVYIGGGTPTNAIDELGVVIDQIRKSFQITGDIAIETTVADINQHCVDAMKKIGINMISLGVQSFDDRLLKLLGRNYRSNQIEPAITMLKQSGFDTINIDLMFALPGQKEADIIQDLNRLITLGVDQITTYPLFTFPYTTVGEYQHLNKIKMPGLFTRRRQYRLIHDYLIGQGFERVSVWGFQKGGKHRYSSVTRDQYIGLGAGAASSFDTRFYFNTFSIEAYEQQLQNNHSPAAVQMNVTPSLQRWYWLYWKLYDTHFSLDDVKQVFGTNTFIVKWIKWFKWLGLCTIKDDEVSLTESGSFWIHLAQNYFILDYINKVWAAMKKEPYPHHIPF